jgi:AraC-like DNA-binding protein
MEERREDDWVGLDGEPLSSAHKAIFEKIEQCKVEIMADRGRISAEAVALHEKHHHHPPLAKLASDAGKQPEQLMREFIAAAEVSARVVDALEGEQVKQIDGSLKRNAQTGLVWKVNSIEKQMSNGVRHKVEISKLQYTLVGTTVAALATIAVALIN